MRDFAQAYNSTLRGKGKATCKDETDSEEGLIVDGGENMTGSSTEFSFASGRGRTDGLARSGREHD